ncbi:hypothetical protein BpHYR1_004590 [Brachionus plicatilis]|uniref:Uncharacterized protein n=1 Tax=Brachionus plicatilis TaxID=10195 RepID=A0A3M7PC18_BRAPC|nr:hypothetical protein BpHYR1_004590 [Brachionus plicatilis]
MLSCSIFVQFEYCHNLVLIKNKHNLFFFKNVSKLPFKNLLSSTIDFLKEFIIPFDAWICGNCSPNLCLTSALNSSELYSSLSNLKNNLIRQITVSNNWLYFFKIDFDKKSIKYNTEFLITLLDTNNLPNLTLSGVPKLYITSTLLAFILFFYYKICFLA